MTPLKVLWLSNKSLLDPDTAGTGSWLSPLAKKLTATGEISLCSITQDSVTNSKQAVANQIQQWVLPKVDQSHIRDGQLPKPFVRAAVKIVEEYSPDLVHIWGTEKIWGLLTARKLINRPALLEMQGLLLAYAEVYAGGLSFKERLACIGFKEILRQSTIFQNQGRFEKWGRFEREIISHHAFITIQTSWMEAQIKALSDSCRIFCNPHFILRYPFYTAAPWQSPTNKVIFCSISDPAPYKGLHVAIRALAILKKQFPGIQLRVAGSLQKTGFRQDGYIRWLNRETERLGVRANICWLGALTASQIIREMQGATAMVLPTFIENWFTAMQEALFIGIPLVVTYTGGIPSLAKDEETVLFFSPGDAEMCAYQLSRLLTDRALAERISVNARKTALVRNDPERIVRNQIEIYRQVLADSRIQEQH